MKHLTKSNVKFITILYFQICKVNNFTVIEIATYHYIIKSQDTFLYTWDKWRVTLIMKLVVCDDTNDDVCDDTNEDQS